jgi:hypothetical protein
MTRQFFHQDKVSVGLTVGLGSMAITALLLTAGLLLAGEPVNAHLRWYGAIFIPTILLIRYYVKQRLSVVTKTLFIVFFLFFIAFMILLFSTHQIAFNS